MISPKCKTRPQYIAKRNHRKERLFSMGWSFALSLTILTFMIHTPNSNWARVPLKAVVVGPQKEE